MNWYVMDDKLIKEDIKLSCYMKITLYTAFLLARQSSIMNKVLCIYLCRYSGCSCITFVAVLWACVNNAGLTRMGEVEMLPVEDFQYVLDVNIFGTVRVTKAFIPLIRQSKGEVLFTSYPRTMFSKLYSASS